MHANLYEYMKLSRNERRAHLKLDTACIEIGGNSKDFRGLLAHYLKTTIETKTKKGQIYLCHACHNAKCSNPEHLYWGTAVDNHLDQVENGTMVNGPAAMRAKYGEEKYLEIVRAAARKGGQANKNKIVSVETRERLSKAAKEFWQRKRDMSQMGRQDGDIVP